MTDRGVALREKEKRSQFIWFRDRRRGRGKASVLGAMQLIRPGESVFLDVRLEAGKTYLLGDFENQITKKFTVG